MHKGLKMQPIPVSGPSITQKEIDYVNDAVKNAWYADANLYNLKFENAFKNYIGSRYAVALPSCTSAIHLALVALGIGPGDEVIVPDVTWIASAAPINYVGANPVFADIDEKTWCISKESFEKCITPKTKALIVVDLYGGMPDMDGIREVASKNNIIIIEDAAEAIGSEYKGKKAGSFGEIGVFSFHGSKTITTGEGGMLVTNREDFYNRILIARDHGRDPQDSRMFWNIEIGYKYKMSSMQAALGLAQLERIDELVGKKRQIFKWYRNRLLKMDGILNINYEDDTILNSFWMITAIIDPALNITKDTLIKEFKNNNISCRPFFYPLSSLPAYFSALSEAATKNVNSYKISPYGINLPSGFNVDENTVNYVCDSFSSIVNRYSK